MRCWTPGVPLALVLLGCGSSPPEPAAPDPTSGAASNPASTAPSSDPTPEATVASTASAAPATPAAPPPPAPETSPFVAQVTVTSGLSELFPVGDALLVSGGTMAFGLWKDGKLDVDEKYTKGLPGYAQLITVVGNWPKVHALVITGNGRIGWGESYRRTARSWMPGRGLTQGVSFQYVTPWDGKRAVAISAPDMPFVLEGPRLHLITERGISPGPKLTAAPGSCRVAAYASSVAVSRDGRIFAFGQRCKGNKDDPFARELTGPTVEWFGVGKRRGTLVDLPPRPGAKADESGYEGARIVEDGEKGILFAFENTDAMLRFDGKTFAVSEKKYEPQPPTVTAADGTEWQQAADRLRRRSPGKDWEDVALPVLPKKGGYSLVASSKHVFVAVGDTLYQLDGPKHETVPEREIKWGTQRASGSFKRIKAADESCERNFALLYGFTKVTPPNYDFPLTRKAIKGQLEFEGTEFVVTEENGKKYFGAFPPSYAIGKKLVARITKQVKGSKPVLLCANPKVVRKLPIDLKTGEVVQ